MADHVLEWVRHGDTPIDHFQIFGERRTGTNYVNRLLADNLDARSTTKYGWKHGYPTMPCIAASGLVVIVVREPLGWLSSLHNRAFTISHEGLDFPRFLRAEWYDRYRPKDFGHARWGYDGMHRASGVANQIDRHPITGKRFRNPLELRKVKSACFLGLLNRECNAVLVDYDTAKDRPGGVIDDVSRLFGISTKGRHHVPGHVGAKGRPKERVRTDDISDADFDFILSRLDHDQEARLGYASCLEPRKTRV